MIISFLMGRAQLARLTLMATLLIFVPKSASQPRVAHPPLRPLCFSQFALVNDACGSIPYGYPMPQASAVQAPPSSMTPPFPSSNHDEHSHHHKIHETEAQKECCQWLKVLDDSCVCDLLVLLPGFLSKPTHSYTVVVDDECEVTYECPGRLVKP